MQGIWYIVVAICCLVIGVVFGILYEKSKKPTTDGTLRQHVDPDDGPYLFLDLKPGSLPTVLMGKKYVTFDVDPSDLISHN